MGGKQTTHPRSELLTFFTEELLKGLSSCHPVRSNVDIKISDDRLIFRLELTSLPLDIVPHHFWKVWSGRVYLRDDYYIFGDILKEATAKRKHGVMTLSFPFRRVSYKSYLDVLPKEVLISMVSKLSGGDLVSFLSINSQSWSDQALFRYLIKSNYIDVYSEIMTIYVDLRDNEKKYFEWSRIYEEISGLSESNLKYIDKALSTSPSPFIKELFSHILMKRVYPKLYEDMRLWNLDPVRNYWTNFYRAVGGLEPGITFDAVIREPNPETDHIVIGTTELIDKSESYIYPYLLLLLNTTDIITYRTHEEYLKSMTVILDDKNVGDLLIRIFDTKIFCNMTNSQSEGATPDTHRCFMLSLIRRLNDVHKENKVLFNDIVSEMGTTDLFGDIGEISTQISVQIIEAETDKIRGHRFSEDDKNQVIYLLDALKEKLKE